LSEEQQEEYKQNLEEIDIMKTENELKKKKYAGNEKMLARFLTKSTRNENFNENVQI